MISWRSSDDFLFLIVQNPFVHAAHCGQDLSLLESGLLPFTERVLNMATDLAVFREVLANGAVLVEGTAELLGGATDRAVLYNLPLVSDEERYSPNWAS